MQTIDEILSARNLTEASREVIRNKGAAGVDAMSVKELKPYLDKNRDELTALILQGKYYPQPIRGKEFRRSRYHDRTGVNTQEQQQETTTWNTNSC